MGLFDRDKRNPSVGDIDWGEKYKDTYTGFEGYPTAITIFEYGCRRIALEKPIFNDKGEVVDTKEVIFDEQRLIKISEDRPVEPRAKIGGARDTHYADRPSGAEQR